MRRRGLLVLLCLTLAGSVWAGAQREEDLAANVASTLRRALVDPNPPRLVFDNPQEAQAWLEVMSARLASKVPDEFMRRRLLTAVHYEATRAGLDPQLVLGLIQVESGFKKYALSTAGARGYMQVMPFWAKLIGNEESNLFHMRTNLRFGCTILRHYLDIEKGDLFRALGRYNGSLGKAEYPNLVRAAWERNWSYPANLRLAQN